MRNNNREGMTLVELLVVIALIGGLIGLLFPAVQKARTTADRVRCSNKLRQLGLALHNYHDTLGSLPAGVSSQRKGEPYPRMSWLTRLLPFIEQEVLWKETVMAYDYQPFPFADPPHIGFSTPMHVFSCPADGRVSDPQQTYQGYRVALTSYVGILGTAYNRPDGTLYLNSRVRLTDIKDGTSNTVIVGERPPSPDFWYGWWYAGYGQAGTGSIDMLLGARELNYGGGYVAQCPPGPYHFQPGRVQDQCDVFHFWSLHSGGANFLFGDGSVRFLAYAADPILPALATRSGGEVVELP